MNASLLVLSSAYCKYRDCGFDLCFEFVRMCVMTATLQLCVRMCVNSGWGGGWGGVVLGTWYQVLGTKYLILIMIIPPFLISPFDRVQTTLFEDLNFSRHRIG